MKNIKTQLNTKASVKYENNGEYLVIRLPSKEYPIESSRINTESKLLQWLNHLTSKPWITKEIIKTIIEVVSKNNKFTKSPM